MSPSKLFVRLGGMTVLARTLRAFEESPEIDGIAVVGNPADFSTIEEAAKEAGIGKPFLLVEGGATRQESVYRGLCSLPLGAEWVAIHDAARPLVTSEVIRLTLQGAITYGAAVACVPVNDTVKRVDGMDLVADTLPRSSLRAAQTPQTFRVSVIRDAHERAIRQGWQVTDDTALVERLGLTVQCVEGDRRNLKITTQEDLALAELWLKTEDSGISSPNVRSLMPRVGFGYDIHRLVEGRPLFLGGVEIAHSHGLEGHSDADVLLHALMDALLGAAGLSDIGHYFPNTDERWRGTSSLRMLREVAAVLHEAGFQIINADMTLLAERPKIAPHLTAMKAAVSDALGIDAASIGIKATTNEGVGSLGREDAMAAHAVAMIFQRAHEPPGQNNRDFRRKRIPG